MATFAVIETGGKQYRVESGSKVRIEKLAAEEGNDVTFDKVLLRSDGGELKIGAPYVSGVVVHGKVIRNARDDKKIIFKYHSKTRYRKKKGHRQHYTEVQISKV
jgi:large subunit ribosomal protein L21